MEKMTLEENQQFAELVIKPMLRLVDLAVATFDTDRMLLTLNDMRAQQSNAAAWPFQGTMDKADQLAIQNDIYAQIIKFMELRISQRDLAIKQQGGTAEQQVIKNLGL